MLGMRGESKGEGRRDHLTLRGGPLGRSKGALAGGTWVGGSRDREEIDGIRPHGMTCHVPRINFI